MLLEPVKFPPKSLLMRLSLYLILGVNAMALLPDAGVQAADCPPRLTVVFAHLRSRLAPPRFLRELRPTDPEWQRIIVRIPAGEPGHSRSPDFATYSGNALEGLRREFDPWFRTGGIESFERMLDRQWDYAAGRTLGQESYNGHFRSNYSTVFYGRRRLGATGFPLEASDFRNSAHYSEMYARVLAGRLSTPGYEERIAIRGIALEDGPTIRLSGRELLVDYPHASILRRYIRRMEILMTEIRATTSNEQLFALLAEYYQLGIAAHLYDRVNSSLYMTQINYILMSRGLRGISHRDLDFLALTRSTEEFIPLFVRDIHAAQALD